MVRRLVDNIHLDGVIYPVGSSPQDPAVRARIGDHAWVGTDEPEPVAEAPAAEVPAAVVGPLPVVTDDAGPADEAPSPGPAVSVEIPPKGGPGSGKAAWAEYARANNVSIEPGASREDIILDLENAGVPTE